MLRPNNDSRPLFRAPVALAALPQEMLVRFMQNFCDIIKITHLFQDGDGIGPTASLFNRGGLNATKKDVDKSKNDHRSCIRRITCVGERVRYSLLVAESS